MWLMPMQLTCRSCHERRIRATTFPRKWVNLCESYCLGANPESEIVQILGI